MRLNKKSAFTPLESRGFTLTELMIVVGIIGILLGMTLPDFTKGRAGTQKNLCKNNLRQIEAAVERWAFENAIAEGYTATGADEDAIYSYLQSGKPACPSSGAYTITPIGSYPQAACSVEGHAIQ